MSNKSLEDAKRAKNDEFYTQYSDIEAEMNAYVEFNPDVFRDKTILLPCDDPEWSNFTKYFAANFERFGLKKLISTSYARGAGNRQITLFEAESPLYDAEKHETHGKLFTITRDANGSGRIDEDDIEFKGYLEGDGDFRSAEVCKLRDEADIIITNPPFSLFREFLAWIMKGDKQFIIIGNQNVITYKEVFPLLKDNKMWLGQGFKSNVGYFRAPLYEDYATAGQHRDGFIRVSGVMWFTNIDHGKRHEPLQLMTMRENLKYNKKLIKKFEKDYGTAEYPHYDNYDAIEVPFTECIPSDYKPCWFECSEAANCPWAEAKGAAREAIALCESGKVKKNEFQAESAMGSWASQSLSSTNTARPSLSFSACSTTEAMAHGTLLPQDAMALKNISDSQYKEKCNGVMGVPITFMNKYNPDQFEMFGADFELAKPIAECIPSVDLYQQGGPALYLNNGDGTHTRLYKRILIRHKMGR